MVSLNGELKYSAGQRGVNKVTIFRARPGAYVYCRARGKEFSLKTTNWEDAKVLAEQLAVKLRTEGDIHLNNKNPTLARIAFLYLEEHSPTKCQSEQQGDERKVDMWLRVAGRDHDPGKFTYQEWMDFCQKRGSGETDARGYYVPPKDRRPVGAATVALDCAALKGMLNWATRRGLIRWNPCRDFPLPSEKNPKRPVVTQERYEKVLAKAGEPTMVVSWARKPVRVQSYLPVILRLAHATGRRITAILSLQVGDLILGEGPHGVVVWKKEHDKRGVEWRVPINEEARQAIDEQLQRRSQDEYLKKSDYLFPSPKDLNKPLRYELAAAWLLRAEALAKVPKQKGGLFHPYRRKWATERKGLPLKDVAAAGGWKDTATLLASYQTADMATMITVVSSRKPLREYRAD